MSEQPLLDVQERQEWLDALDSVVREGGVAAGEALINALSQHAENTGVPLPLAITTPFRNTIAPANERPMPGDLFMERRIRSLIRWNAMAMVMRANDNDEGLGGHISSFSSSATLYDVGMNYFFSLKMVILATSSFIRDIAHRACMQDLSLKATLQKRSCKIFVGKSTGRG